MTLRQAKMVMCLALGIYAVIAAIDNIVDPMPNLTFLYHVLSMDTALPDSLLRSRAVTSSTLQRLAFDGIIAGEAITGLLYLIAAGALWHARRSPADGFERAKRWAYAAGVAGFMVWFVGFEIGGGEWFAMWQSQHWNGQPAAFRFYMTILAVLIFVSQPDPDEADPPRP